MRVAIKAFSIVGIAAIIGYEIGMRKWEDEKTREVVSKVVSLNNELVKVQKWAEEEGPKMGQQEFANKLSQKLEIIYLIAKNI